MRPNQLGATWPSYYGGHRAAAVTDSPPEIPEPEVRARPATREEVPDVVASFVKKFRKAGWKLRITYARGPLMKKDGTKVLAIVDSISVIFADGGKPQAQGIWHRRDPVTLLHGDDEDDVPADGKYKFWTGFVVRGKDFRRANMVGLRKYLNDNIPF